MSQTAKCFDAIIDTSEWSDHVITMAVMVALAVPNNEATNCFCHFVPNLATLTQI